MRQQEPLATALAASRRTADSGLLPWPDVRRSERSTRGLAVCPASGSTAHAPHVATCAFCTRLRHRLTAALEGRPFRRRRPPEGARVGERPHAHAPCTRRCLSWAEMEEDSLGTCLPGLRDLCQHPSPRHPPAHRLPPSFGSVRSCRLQPPSCASASWGRATLGLGSPPARCTRLVPCLRGGINGRGTALGAGRGAA